MSVDKGPSGQYLMKTILRLVRLGEQLRKPCSV